MPPKRHSRQVTKTSPAQAKRADDTMLEIARLQERIRLLELENQVLREYAEQKTSPNPSEPEVQKKTTIQLAPLSAKGTKGCSCKGQCGSKICGCVKREQKCGPTCKCNAAACQNQEWEDVTHIVPNTKNAHKDHDKPLINVHVEKSPFSPPDNEKEDPRIEVLNESITFHSKKLAFSPSEDEDEENVVVTNKNKKKEKKEEIQEENDPDFDPTKPTYQLLRTPPSKTILEHTTPIKRHSDVHLPPPPPSEVKQEEESASPPELLQPQVDWSEHQAQLVPCKKCNRKFYSFRIKKHEACCKKV